MLKRLALAALVLAVLVPIGLAIERRTRATLPAPTGTLEVGRTEYDWADERSGHELLAWIWYPAQPSPSAAPDGYLPHEVLSPVQRMRSGIMGALTRDLARVHGYSFRDAPLAAARRTYPVVLLRAGASSEVWNYSSLAEDLASHGYIVAGIDAPYRTGVVVFPDGRVAERLPRNNPELCVEKQGADQTACVRPIFDAWLADMRFAVDRLDRLNASDPSGRFTGRIDMTRVGVLGHSFGGAQAAQFCHDDDRCRAGVDLDGAPFGSVIAEGIQRPFMILVSDHSSEPDSPGVERDIQSLYDRLPPDGRVLAMIRGANHFTFSDDGAVLKSRLLIGMLRLFGRLKIDRQRQIEVTRYCLDTFFDRYLKGDSGSPVNVMSRHYPEIVQAHSAAELTGK